MCSRFAPITERQEFVSPRISTASGFTCTISLEDFAILSGCTPSQCSQTVAAPLRTDTAMMGYLFAEAACTLPRYSHFPPMQSRNSFSRQLFLQRSCIFNCHFESSNCVLDFAHVNTMAHTLGMSIRQYQQKSLLKFYVLPRAKKSRFPEKFSEKRLEMPWVKVQFYRICLSRQLASVSVKKS